VAQPMRMRHGPDLGCERIARRAGSWPVASPGEVKEDEEDETAKREEELALAHTCAHQLQPARRCPEGSTRPSTASMRHHGAATSLFTSDATSSANLVVRPLSTPGATRRLADAFRRGPRRYKTRSKQGGRALLQRESRCVLVLPAPPLGPPRRPSLARSSSSRRFDDAMMS